MADLVITVANMEIKSDTSSSKVQAGETITPGQAVYKKTADSKYYKADANDSAHAVAGIALTYASADGYFLMATAGDLDIGATIASGTQYISSATAGGIAPIADLATGMYLRKICSGKDGSTTVVTINLDNTGSLVP